MKPGSVVVDLAGETGGNCELTEPGQTVVKHGVTDRLAAEPAGHHARARQRAVREEPDLAAGTARSMTARWRPTFDDEVIAASCVRPRQEAKPKAGLMYTQLLANLAILVLAGFVGFAVISKVPNTLHTPLMSGTNAIHGIVVLGALLVLGKLPADAPWGVRIIAFVALMFGTLNVIGGFLVTDRMLGMFKGKKSRPEGRGS